MILPLYRKLINLAYNKYVPYRNSKARKSLDRKKYLGFNSTYLQGSISPSMLTEGFKQAGLAPSDTIFIRTSLSAANAVEGGVSAYLRALMDYFEEGNIIMSSYTFNKSPLMYLADNPLFDPDYSLDQLNLVSEFFRRQKGTYRSIHPTHSVTAWGKDAEWLTADHHKSRFCYSTKSPFARMFKLDTKEISVGVFPTSITFHYIEQFLPDDAPCYRDMTIPIMSRVMVNGQEQRLPFCVTDPFASYLATYNVFVNTPAEPTKFFFDNKVDFYTLNLCNRLATMKELAAKDIYWHVEPSKAKNFTLKHIIKPLVLKGFFEKKDDIFYPIKGPSGK